MDCERFEPLLLDELYDELDEVTSAAVKRHASGCARCGPLLDDLRVTRRRALLPMVELPEGLEDRILAAVKDAQKIVPIQSRASRALSWAGSWAMRPQTAMAAVFLLMIGTSAFVIRSRHSSSERADAVSVTEQGMPAGQATSPEDPESLDSKAAAAAHGPNQPAPVRAPPMATASGALALGDPLPAGAVDGLTGGKGRPLAYGKADNGAFGSLADDKTNKDEEQQRSEKKKSGDLGPSDIANAAPPAGAPNAAPDYAARSQATAPPVSRSGSQDPQDGFSAGMAAYRARNFVEATRQFDSTARSGDQNAALWAAKSVRDGNGGCSAALPRYDAVAQNASGTYAGNQAQLEAAQCLTSMGQLDAARERLTRLTSVPSHAAQAQQALNDLDRVAAKRTRGGGAAGGRAAPAPARATSKPATPTADDATKATY